VEGIVQIKTGQLLSLSEQQLVSCDNADGNAGCSGGDMYAALGYIMQNGASAEAGYPYTAQNSSCNVQQVCTLWRMFMVGLSIDPAIRSVEAEQPIGDS
jgi:hypothetical protein